MDLDGYLQGKGEGARNRLHEQTRLSLPVIARACEGRASLASAIKLHEATGKTVPISSMTREEVPAALEPRRRKTANR
jgi:hypothetical protein